MSVQFWMCEWVGGCVWLCVYMFICPRHVTIDNHLPPLLNECHIPHFSFVKFGCYLNGQIRSRSHKPGQNLNILLSVSIFVSHFNVTTTAVDVYVDANACMSVCGTVFWYNYDILIDILDL